MCVLGLWTLGGSASVLGHSTGQLQYAASVSRMATWPTALSAQQMLTRVKCYAASRTGTPAPMATATSRCTLSQVGLSGQSMVVVEEGGDGGPATVFVELEHDSHSCEGSQSCGHVCCDGRLVLPCAQAERGNRCKRQALPGLQVPCCRCSSCLTRRRRSMAEKTSAATGKRCAPQAPGLPVEGLGSRASCPGFGGDTHKRCALLPVKQQHWDTCILLARLWGAFNPPLQSAGKDARDQN